MHRVSRLLAGVIAAIAVVGGVLVPPPAAQAAEGIFVMPVSGRVADLVKGCPAGSRPTHEGVDINLNSNTPIYAAAGGTVTTAANSNATTGYGSQVVITHPSGHKTRYAHMVYGSLAVKVGAVVPRGAVLGRVGSTGNSTGPHLHFEMFRNGVNVTNRYFICGQANVVALRPLEPRPSKPVNADYNGDAKADLLAVSEEGRMTAYNGNGAGRWTTKLLGMGWESTRLLVHGDFTGDNRGDFLAARTDGTLWLYRGKGANGFTSTQIGSGWNGLRLISGGADFDSDGIADVVAVGADGYLYLYRGTGAGKVTLSGVITQGWANIDMMVAGDFNRDGAGDIMARDTTGKLFFSVGNGSGVLAPVQVGHGWGVMTALTGGADYTGDGRADIIARDAAGDLWLYAWSGSAFSARVKVGHGWNVHRLIH